MHGEEEMEVKHPALEPILAETYGIIVYQEQIFQILNQLADYTLTEADLVRQAISKKDAAKIEYHKALFIGGCGKNGISASEAQAIYADIEFFARYGFNKAHAADYAVITVQTAYLKAKYPVEYMAALLLVERDKTEKVVNFIQGMPPYGHSRAPARRELQRPRLRDPGYTQRRGRGDAAEGTPPWHSNFPYTLGLPSALAWPP